MNIGFIGLGNMGSGMAACLLRYCQDNKHRLSVFDVNRSVVSDFVARGAVGANSVAEVARKSKVLFTSLPGAKEINQVACGRDGILENLPDHAIWFETSTNDPGEWKRLRTLAPNHLSLIDAPVSGGREGAVAGRLTMMLGVEQDLGEQHHEILRSFTGKAIRMGPPGAGYATKMCQLHLNYLVAYGIGETLALGEKSGIDLSLLHEVLKDSCAQSYVVDQYIPKVLDGSYDPSFTLGLAAKDMRLLDALGQELNIALDLTSRVSQAYQEACKAYGDDAPHLSVVKLITQQSPLSGIPTQPRQTFPRKTR